MVFGLLKNGVQAIGPVLHAGDYSEEGFVGMESIQPL